MLPSLSTVASMCSAALSMRQLRVMPSHPGAMLDDIRGDEPFLAEENRPRHDQDQRRADDDRPDRDVRL